MLAFGQCRGSHGGCARDVRAGIFCPAEPAKAGVLSLAAGHCRPRGQRRAARRRRGTEPRGRERIELLECPPEEPDVTGDAAADLSEAVAKLPDAYREVIVLRFYDRQSCAEISRGLDIPLGTVTKRLSRAYSLLRETWRRKRGQAPFAGTALRVLRTKGACPLFPKERHRHELPTVPRRTGRLS